LAAGAFEKCRCQIKFDKSMHNLHIPNHHVSTDYLEMIIIFGECNARDAARVFSERFPKRNHPDHNAESDGKDARDRSSSTKSTIARTVENEETILNAVEEDGRYLKHWRNCAPIGYF
jgi:hypothetical protein